jgi:hypothetical protein
MLKNDPDFQFASSLDLNQEWINEGNTGTEGKKSGGQYNYVY